MLELQLKGLGFRHYIFREASGRSVKVNVVVAFVVQVASRRVRRVNVGHRMIGVSGHGARRVRRKKGKSNELG